METRGRHGSDIPDIIQSGVGVATGHTGHDTLARLARHPGAALEHVWVPPSGGELPSEANSAPNLHDQSSMGPLVGPEVREVSTNRHQDASFLPVGLLVGSVGRPGLGRPLSPTEGHPPHIPMRLLDGPVLDARYGSHQGGRRTFIAPNPVVPTTILNKTPHAAPHLEGGVDPWFGAAIASTPCQAARALIPFTGAIIPSFKHGLGSGIMLGVNETYRLLL